MEVASYQKYIIIIISAYLHLTAGRGSSVRMGELSTNYVLIYLMSVPTNSLSKLSQKRNASHLKSITHIMKIESRR